MSSSCIEGSVGFSCFGAWPTFEFKVRTCWHLMLQFQLVFIFLCYLFHWFMLHWTVSNILLLEHLSPSSLYSTSAEPKWLHSWQLMSYMICLYLQETGLFLVRGSSLKGPNQRPLPASTTPLKQQIAVTLAVCSGPLAHKRGGHFGDLRWNRHYVAWTSASWEKSVSCESCVCPLWDWNAGR